MKWILVAVVGLVACGGKTAPDLAAWNSDVATAQQRVTAYQTTVTNASVPASCTNERDAYVNDLKPLLSRMRDMSGTFDDCFGMMNQASFATVEGMCSDMDFELDRYATAGCPSSDVETNRTSGLDHCRRMLDYLDQAASRSASMHDMLASKGMMTECR